MEKCHILYYGYITIENFFEIQISYFFFFLSFLGIINLCKPGNSGIQSLIGVLCIPNMEIRVGKSYDYFIHGVLVEEINWKKFISGNAFSS